jgi:hypothetical protein
MSKKIRPEILSFMSLCESCKQRVDSIQTGVGEALEICSKCNVMELMDYIEVMRIERLDRLETPISLEAWEENSISSWLPPTV